jgi:hypothetical protein
MSSISVSVLNLFDWALLCSNNFLPVQTFTPVTPLPWQCLISVSDGHNLFFVGSGVELRALCLLGKYSTLEPHPNPFCFGLFQVWPCFCPGPALACSPLTYASQVSGITVVHHHSSLLVEMGCC